MKVINNFGYIGNQAVVDAITGKGVLRFPTVPPGGSPWQEAFRNKNGNDQAKLLIKNKSFLSKGSLVKDIDDLPSLEATVYTQNRVWSHDFVQVHFSTGNFLETEWGMEVDAANSIVLFTN